MRPKTKALSYLRRMISQGKFKVNDKLPPIQNIASSLNISVSTVKKAISILDSEKIIQNYGRLGVFVMSNAHARHYTNNRISFLAHLASLNVDLSLMSHSNYKTFGNFGIAVGDYYIEAVNFITHKRFKTTHDELNNILQSPITIDNLVNSNDSKNLKELKLKFKRQKELSQIARLVHLHKKELELNG